ncbi:MAG TPA: hypothetical protein VJ953_09200 [Saprospiraceae bacterium]|nr:hypothetical protein [Saprospiraceae bacterium]
MIDKVQKALQEASLYLKEQAGSFSGTARDKAYQLIDDWLAVFPKLENYGLRMNSCALSAAISPALEVEMLGDHQQFPPERLDEIIQEIKTDTALLSVFKTIRTTYNIHRKINPILNEPLIVKIKVRLSPEIKVYVGEPLIE